MPQITKELVLAYLAGGVTNPRLLERIEEARDNDQKVKRWFDILDPDLEEDDDTNDRDGELPVIIELPVTIRMDFRFVSTHTVPILGVAKPPALPKLDLELILPSQAVSNDSREVTLKYASEDIPLGVASVDCNRLNDDGSEAELLGSRLVVFRRKWKGEDRYIRVAEVSLDSLGVPPAEEVKVNIYVVPTTIANLDHLKREAVLTLRDACNGDVELRQAVEDVLNLLPKTE